MEDFKSELFDIIRKNSSTLWIGSGLSRYAGYISTYELCNKLLTLLPTNQIEELKNKDLQTIAQAVEDINANGRIQINELLEHEFTNKIPESNEYHKLLAKIPHFKTIITTNYDRLIEMSYGVVGQAIITDHQLHYLDDFKVQILKIHGDTSEPNSIIISKNDYVKFFSTEQKNIWSFVHTKISTQHQIFVGYDLNDINVNSIFEKVLSNLKYLNRPSFLIAPNLSHYKIINLSNKNIKYINLTGEKFINELYKNISENIIEDQRTGKVDSEVFRKFLGVNNLKPTLVGGPHGYTVRKIEGVNGDINGHINFTLKAPPEFINEFSDYIKGKSVVDFTIPLEHVSDVEIKAEDISIIKGDEISLIFKYIPSYEGVIDLTFKSLELEFNEIPVKSFVTSNIFKIEVNLKSGILYLEKNKMLDNGNLSFSFKIIRKDAIGKTSNEIRYYSFIKQFFDGDEFSLVINGQIYKHRISKNEDMVNKANLYLSYFNKLKIIENNYNIRFENYSFEEINGESENLVDAIIEAISTDRSERELDGNLKATLDDSWDRYKILQLRKLRHAKEGISIQQLNKTFFSLHGHTIEMGYLKLQFINLTLLNEKALLRKKTRKAEFRSEYGKYYVSYISTLTPIGPTL